MTANKKALLDYVFNLQVQQDQLSKSLFEQKQRVQDLDDRIQDSQNQVRYQQELRKAADERGGGVNASKSLKQLHQKKVSILENRLAATKQRHSEAITENNSIKEKIDRKREVRITHNEIYQKFQKQLQEYSKLLDESMEVSDKTMQDRDALVGQTEDLIALGREEKRAFQEIYDELTQLIEAQKEETDKFLKNAAVIKYEPPPTAILSQRKSSRNNRQNEAADKVATENKESKIYSPTSAEYDEAFRKVMNLFPGVEDYQIILENFLQTEEEMMKLMKQIQMINDEINLITDQIELTREEKDHYVNDLTEGALDVRRRFIEKMQKNKAIIDEEAQSYAQLREEKLASFHNVTKICERIFSSLGCGDFLELNKDGPSKSMKNAANALRKPSSTIPVLPRPQSLGQSIQVLGVNENNVSTYMEVIEEKANQIIEDFVRYQRDTHSPLPKTALAPPTFGHNHLALALPIPEIDGNDDVAVPGGGAALRGGGGFDSARPVPEDVSDVRAMSKEELINQAAADYHAFMASEGHAEVRSKGRASPVRKR